MALTRTLMACSLLAVGMASVAAGQPSQLRGAATRPPPPPEAPANAAAPQANPPGDVQDGYTVVPDTYMEGVWTPVQGPFATAKADCDYYDACRGFSQKDGDDQYWWLGTGNYTTGKLTYPAPGYTTYLKAASSGASGTSNQANLSAPEQCKQLFGTYCAGGGQACNCAYCDDFSKNDECANTCRVMNGYFSSPFQGNPWVPVTVQNPVNAPDGTDCSWMKGNGQYGQGDDCKQCNPSAMKCRRANPPHIGATYLENSGGNCKAW